MEDVEEGLPKGEMAQEGDQRDKQGTGSPGRGKDTCKRPQGGRTSSEMWPADGVREARGRKRRFVRVFLLQVKSPEGR